MEKPLITRNTRNQPRSLHELHDQIQAHVEFPNLPNDILRQYMNDYELWVQCQYMKTELSQQTLFKSIDLFGRKPRAYVWLHANRRARAIWNFLYKGVPLN